MTIDSSAPRMQDAATAGRRPPPSGNATFRDTAWGAGV
jgi:hypothetical protein